MKRKVLQIIIFIISGILLSGCTDTLSTVKELQYLQVKEKIDANETFILEVIQTGCGNCEKFSPRLKKILSENNIKAFSLNLSDLTLDEKKEFAKIANVSGTPTVLFFVKGKEDVMHRIVGAVENKEVITKLKAMKYIK